MDLGLLLHQGALRVNYHWGIYEQITGYSEIFWFVKTLNIPSVHKYLNGNLPLERLETLEFNKINHSIGTRGDTTGIDVKMLILILVYSLLLALLLELLQGNFPLLNLSELMGNKSKNFKIPKNLLKGFYNIIQSKFNSFYIL